MESIKIELAINDSELDQCAVIMSKAEPFITLKLNYEKCRMAMRGDHKEVYLAITNGLLVGFVVLQSYGVLRGYIQTICIDPEHRGQGIGTDLIRFSEEKLFKQFPNVFICVTSFNEAAQKLYYHLGYTKIGTLKDHYIFGADEYILRKQKFPISEFRPEL